MQPVRWGVLSTANIARLVIQANRASEGTRFVAVASRDPARAQRFAAELGLEARGCRWSWPQLTPSRAASLWLGPGRGPARR
jgi:predicted dehydrogenase